MRKVMFALAILAVATPAQAQRECGNYGCSFLGHPSTWTQPYGQPRLSGAQRSARPQYTASQLRARRMLERVCARTGCY